MHIETERAWHARQLVSELTLQELESYDGIVAVGHPASGCSALQSMHAGTPLTHMPNSKW